MTIPIWALAALVLVFLVNLAMTNVYRVLYVAACRKIAQDHQIFRNIIHDNVGALVLYELAFRPNVNPERELEQIAAAKHAAGTSRSG